MDSIMQVFDAFNAYHRGNSIKEVYGFATQNTCEVLDAHPERGLKKDITGLLDHVIEHEEVPEHLELKLRKKYFLRSAIDLLEAHQKELKEDPSGLGIDLVNSLMNLQDYLFGDYQDRLAQEKSQKSAEKLPVLYKTGLNVKREGIHFIPTNQGENKKLELPKEQIVIYKHPELSWIEDDGGFWTVMGSNDPYDANPLLEKLKEIYKKL